MSSTWRAVETGETPECSVGDSIQLLLCRNTNGWLTTTIGYWANEVELVAHQDDDETYKVTGFYTIQDNEYTPYSDVVYWQHLPPLPAENSSAATMNT